MNTLVVLLELINNLQNVIIIPLIGFTMWIYRKNKKKNIEQKKYYEKVILLQDKVKCQAEEIAILKITMGKQADIIHEQEHQITDIYQEFDELKLTLQEKDIELDIQLQNLQIDERKHTLLLVLKLLHLSFKQYGMNDSDYQQFNDVYYKYKQNNGNGEGEAIKKHIDKMAQDAHLIP